MSNNMMNQVARLTLRDAEEMKGSSLYVVNRSEPRGLIHLTVTSAKGRDHVVTIPDTWVPFDVSGYANKDDIIQSPSFRQAVSRGFILIVDTKSADDLFAENEQAQYELNRVHRSLGGNTAAESDFQTRTGMQAKQDEINRVAGTMVAASDAEKSGATVSGAVLQIISRSNIEGDDAMDPKEAVSLLLGHTLTRADLEYIVNNSTQDSVKDFAAKQLNG